MKEAYEGMKDDALYLAAAFLLTVIALKIVFYSESLLLIIKSSAMFFWLFAIPGFFLTHYWRGQIGRAERIVLGTGLGAGVQVFLTYYTGWMGLHLKYQPILLPIIMLAVAGIIIAKTTKPLLES